MSTGFKLYEITYELQYIEDLLLENGGVLDEEVEAHLDRMQGALAEKADNICALRQQFLRSAEGAKAEAARLTALQKAWESSAKGLEAYLQRNLEALQQDRLDTTRFKIGVYTNTRPSIRWDGDVTDLPEPLRRVEIKLDGTAAYSAWKAGTLPEGFVVETGRHLRIK